MSNTKIGQLYLELAVSLKKWEAGLRQGAGLLSELFDQAENKEINIDVNDKQLAQSVGRFKQYISTLTTLFNNAIQMFDTYNSKAANVAQYTQAVTNMFDAFANQMHVTNTELTALVSESTAQVKTINDITESTNMKPSKAMEHQRTQLEKITLQATKLKDVLAVLGTSLISEKSLGIDKLINIPGVDTLLGPFTQFIQYMKTDLHDTLATTKTLLDASFSGEAIPIHTLTATNKTLEESYTKVQGIAYLFAQINKLAINNNSVLLQTNDLWTSMGKGETNKRFVALKKVMGGINDILQKLQVKGLASDDDISELNTLVEKARAALENKVGAPISNIFDAAGKRLRSLARELETLGVRKELITDITGLDTSIKHMTMSIKEYDVYAGKLNLNLLAGSSKEASQEVRSVRKQLEPAVKLTKSITTTAESLQAVIQRLKTEMGQGILSIALDNDKEKLAQLRTALGGLDDIAKKPQRTRGTILRAIGDKGEFTEVNLLLNDTERSLSSIITLLAGPGFTGANKVMADVFNATTLTQFRRELEAVGQKMSGETLQKTPVEDMVVILEKLRQTTSYTISQFPTLLNLLRLVGAETFKTLIQNSFSADKVKTELNGVTTVLDKFLQQFTLKMGKGKQAAVRRTAEILGDTASQMLSREINIEQIDQEVQAGIGKIIMPLRETHDLLVKVQQSFQILRRSAGIKMDSTSINEFTKALSTMQSAIYSIYNMAVDDKTDSITRLIELSKFGIGEEAVLNLQELVGQLHALFATSDDLNKFNDQWASGQVINVMKEIIAILGIVESTNKSVMKAMSVDLSKFESTINTVIASVKNNYANLMNMRKTTRYTKDQFEEFSNAKVVVDEMTQAIITHTKTWEYYQQEMLRIKKLKPEELLLQRNAAIANKQGDLEGMKKTAIETLTEQQEFERTQMSGESPAQKAYNEYVNILSKRAADEKRAATKKIEIYHDAAMKIRRLEEGTTKQREEALRTELSRLTNEQNKYGVSLENLQGQLKKWESIQKEVGQLLPHEVTQVLKLKEAINELGIAFTTTAELQDQLNKASRVPEQLGRTYTAITERLKVYRKEFIKTLENTTQYLQVTGALTESELNYQQQQEQTNIKLTERKNISESLLKLEQLIGSREKIKVKDTQTGKMTDEYNTLRAAVLNVNKELKAMGSNLKIKFDIQNIGNIRNQLVEVRQALQSEMQTIIDGFIKQFDEFEFNFKVGEHSAKAEQELVEITKNLKALGAAEKTASQNKALHVQRILELEKAFKLERYPREQLLQFLTDEIARGTTNLEIMKKENAARGKLSFSKLEEKRASVTLLRAKELLTAVQTTEVSNTKEYVRVQKDAEQYMERLSNRAKEATGRYRGVQKALQSLVSDVKNLIQVQIRWYATQALIFKSIEAIKGLFTFYNDLEQQVAKVTTVLVAEGNVAQTNALIYDKLTREMIRTGKTAEELSTILWELVSAGISHKEAMEGVTHITNLAVAAELDLNETTRIASGLYRVFGDELNIVGTATDRWRYIVDRLSATLNMSQVDMNGLVSGLGYLINEADAAGLQFEQVLGILSVLNNRLLLGSKAGRSASRVLTQLTSNAKEITKAFGIDIDYTGTLDLLDLLRQLNGVIEQNTINGEITIETFDKLQDIFGQVGKRAAVGLITNLKELEKTISDLKTDKFTNLTEEMASVKLAPFSTQAAKVVNAFKVLGAEGVNPFMELATWIVNTVNAMAEFILKSNGLVRTIGGWVIEYAAATKALSLLASVGKWAGFELNKSLLLIVGKFALKFKSLGKIVTLTASAFTTYLLPALLKVPGVSYITVIAVEKISTALKAVASNTKLLGAVILGIVAVTTLAYKVYTKYKNTLLNTSKALADAKANYMSITDTIDQEVTNFTELVDAYKTAIPYTEKWYQTRENISNQYPELLTQMDTELALTGDITTTLKSLIAQKEHDLELTVAKEQLNQKSLEFLDAAEKKTRALTKQVLEYQQTIAETTWTDRLQQTAASGGGWTGLGGMIGEEASRYIFSKLLKSDLNKSQKDLITYADDFKRITGKELPDSLKILTYALTEIHQPTESLLTLVDVIERAKKTNLSVTSEFLRMFSELTPQIQNAIKKIPKIDLSIGATISTQQLNAIANELQSSLNDAVNISTSFSFKTEMDTLLNAVTQMSDAWNKSASQDLGDTQRTKILALATDIETKIPAALKQLLEEYNFTLSALLTTTFDKHGDLLGSKIPNTVQEGLNKVKNDVKTKLNEINLMLSARTIGIGNTIILEMTKLSTALPSEFKTIQTKIKFYYALMDTDARTAFHQRIGPTFKEFIKFLHDETPTATEALIKSFHELEKASHIASNAFKLVLKNKLDDMQKLTTATNNLINLMSKLTGMTRPIIVEYVETNKQLLVDLMNSIPTETQQVLRNVTTMEQIELIKTLKDTKNKIREEIGSLGVQSTTPIRELISLRQYQETFNKVKTISKSVYEEQIKLQNEWFDTVKSSLSGVDTEYSSFATAQIEIERQKFEVIKQYHQKRLELQKLEEIETTLLFKPTERANYLAAESALEQITRKFEEIDAESVKLTKALNIVTDGIKQFKLQFKTEEEARLLVDTDIFGKNLDALRNLAQASEHEIENGYYDLLSQLNNDQRVFFDKLVTYMEKEQHLTTKNARQWLQMLVSTAQLTGKTTFNDAIDVLVNKLNQDNQFISNKMKEVTLELQKISLDATTTFLQGLNTVDEQAESLQNLRTFYEKNAIQESMALYQIQYKAQKEHYQRMETVRKKDIQDLESYTQAYQNILDTSTLQKILSKQLEVQTNMYLYQRKQRELDLDHARKVYQAELALDKLAIQEASRLPQQETINYTEKEQEKIDALNAVITQSREHELTRTIAFNNSLLDIMDSTLQEKIKLVTSANADQLEETQQTTRQETDIVARAISTREEIIDAARRRTAIQETQAYEQRQHNLQQLASTITALELSLATMFSTQVLEHTNKVNSSFKQLGDNIAQNFKEALAGAMTSIKDVNNTSLIDTWIKDSKTIFDKKTDELSASFNTLLSAAFTSGVDADTINQAASAFQKNLNRVYIDSYKTLRLNLIEEQKNIQKDAYFLLDIQQALSPKTQDYNMSTLARLGVNIKELASLQNNIKITYEEQNKVLSDQINKYTILMQQLQDKYKLEQQTKANAYIEYQKLINAIKADNRTATEDTILQYALLYQKTQELKTSIPAEEMNASTTAQVVANEQLLKLLRQQNGFKEAHNLLTRNIVNNYQDYVDASTNSKILQLQINNILEDQEAILQRLQKAAKASANPWHQFKLGVEEAIKGLIDAAFDLEQVGKDVITGLSSALQEGFSNTVNELALAFSGDLTDEETSLQESLMQKQQEIAELQRKIADVELGGVDYGETGELENLQAQLKAAQKEVNNFNKELQLAGDHSNRLADIWKEVGKTIIDQLISVATQMLANIAITLIFKAISSAIGSIGGNYQDQVDIWAAKGGILPKGFNIIQNTPSTSSIIEKVMGAKFFSEGGIASSPTLGVVGEGGQNEAIVPLPDNRSIPVTFTGGEKPGEGVKIMNVVDPSLVPATLLEHPETVINIIGTDIQRRGTTYHTFKALAKETK